MLIPEPLKPMTRVATIHILRVGAVVTLAPTYPIHRVAAPTTPLLKKGTPR